MLEQRITNIKSDLLKMSQNLNSDVSNLNTKVDNIRKNMSDSIRDLVEVMNDIGLALESAQRRIKKLED
jgi:flagellar hook-associated protein FlgK|tara:strand:- start:4857 stop:5063 length:207 start_codon:yes stop_codon:yes gene_type:complete